MRFVALFASSLLSTLSVSAPAQEISIPYDTFTLDNGLQVIVHEDHSDPVVAVYVYYHVGSAREELGKSGFAHLFEHMLFQGSEHVGDEMHFKYVTEAGGTLNGSTNTDRTNYFETLPSNQLELALWLESDRMGFLLPALTPATLANQIDVVKNERRQNYENRPYGQSAGAIAAALYPKEHPYSWLTIGSHEDLTNASLDDVKNFFRRWYGPNNATLAIGGDVKLADARALVERYFGPIPRGPGVDRAAPRPVTLTESKRLVLEDKVKLPELIYTWPTVNRGNDDDVPLSLLDAVLAENKSSVLTKALMIDEQLASSVQASSECNELAGTFSITLRAQRGVSLDVLEAKMHTLLAKLADEGVDPAALARVVTRGEAQIVRQFETVSARTSRLANDNALLGRPDAYKESLRRRRNATAADLNRVLKHYILGQPAVVMSVVPDGKRDMAAKDKPLPAAIVAKTAELDRKQKPAPGAMPDFRSPAVWHDQLGNGLAMAGIAWRELPLSTLAITVPAGRARETMSTLGLSSFVASMMQQGTRSLDAVAYTEALDRLGADIRVDANDEEIVFRLSCLDAHFPDAAKLLADVILNPRFDAADFERTKKERLTAIETRADQIRLIAGDVFNRLLYGNDAVTGRSALGTKATITPLKLDDVRSFWKSFVVPGGARLAYVGGLDASALKKQLEPLSHEWKGAGPALAAPATALAFDATHLYLVDKPGAAQSEVRIGHAGPSSKDKDYYALTILNWPLGGSFSSRINLNLREDKGYTYGARSTFEGGLSNGPFVASGGVKTDVTAESVVEFMKEITGIVGGVKPEELAFTKDSLAQAARRQYESTRELLTLVENAGKYGWPDDFPAKRLKELDAMTLDRLKSLAGQWIHPDHMAILVVGDKQRILDKLQKLGYGEPIELDADGNPVGRAGGR